MRASYLFILALIALFATCIGVILWGLNPSIFNDLEEKLDLSDAVLTAVVLLLLIFAPMRAAQQRTHHTRHTRH